jgi:hypothetical protein
MTIIEKMHKELRDNIVITHTITEKYLGNEENQIAAGSFDHINVDEEFKIKFTVKNKNYNTNVDLTNLIIKGSVFAKVVGPKFAMDTVKIPKGQQWESNPITMLALKTWPMGKPEPIVEVKLKMRISANELLYFEKEELEFENIMAKVPDVQHN